MNIKEYRGSKYVIKYIDTHEIECDLLNCSDVAICVDGFRVGNYDFIKNQYENTEWYCEQGQDTFSRLTKRQQKLILKFANNFIKKIYQQIYYSKIKNGDFFAPTEENQKAQLYYTKRIQKAKNNIKELEA